VLCSKRRVQARALLPANLSSGEEAGGLKQTAAKATKNKPGTVKELKFSAEKLRPGTGI